MVAELCGIHQHADVRGRCQFDGVGANAQLFLAHRFQYFLAGGIAFASSRKIGAPLQTWFWFIGTFAFGKIIWEIEQYRYREGTCPTSALNPVYWFHAGWHVFAAAAHHAAMRFHGELWVATRRKEV